MVSPRGRKSNKGKGREEQIRVNENIGEDTVLVVDEEGTQLGMLDVREAIDIAVGSGLDLVEVSRNSKPPVCRIMDFGKYKYEISKRKHEARRKQKIIHVKEIKLRPKTEDHDFDFKIKHALQFLNDGDKVKVTIIYRGREVAYRELGLNLLSKFAKSVEETGVIEVPARADGRTAVMVLAPKK